MNPKIFSTLSDPNRFAVFDLLKSSGELLTPVLISRILKINDKTVSKALVALSEAELVSGLHQGRHTFYTINKKTISSIIIFFSTMESRNATQGHSTQPTKDPSLGQTGSR